MSNILDGIRVLDFGRYIGGPFCATLLGDLGAEVIRIEKPSGGEDRYTVPVTADGEGAYFVQLGRNKRGMTLNPTLPAGREVVQRLVRTADVVVANLPPPALATMGLDYATLKALKPDILVKGGDYSVDQVVGAPLVNSWGGEVKVLNFVESCSTTAIVERIRERDKD